VGASLAGATTAVQVRRLGHAEEIVLVGDETHLPYERPALSKGYLAGRLPAEALHVYPAGTYRELGIELRTGATAIGLDVAHKTVQLAHGESVRYDSLVIATGSRNITPPIPGMHLSGVHQLRRIEDADRLSASARQARSAVVVGMGFIGCEVAATLRRGGLEVTMVDRLSGPLIGPLGPVLSERVRDWHAAKGVRLLPGVDVAAFDGDAAVEAVRLADGRRLRADLVVVGVGVRPATDWLTDAPVHLVRGAVSVDDHGRTSTPDVYAAGDVAAVWNPTSREHRRLEHYRSAIDQGLRVAHAVLEQPLPTQAPSWFWSEQYEHVLHLAGDREGAHLHLRENPFVAFFTRGRILSAVATLDNGRDFRRALRLLDAEVDVSALADPDVEVRRLGRASAAPQPDTPGQQRTDLEPRP
jgi:3-phenylpropionate/trans-cinnamate dioxygenase ferredoxin reductase subunit